jgi:hypothetical protein
VNAVTAHRRNRDRIRHQLTEHGKSRGPSHSALSGVPATRPPPVPGGTTRWIAGRPGSVPPAGARPATGLEQQHSRWTNRAGASPRR